MYKTKKRRLPSLSDLIVGIIWLAFGFGAGWFGGAVLASREDIFLPGALAGAVAGFLAQIVLHEGGHLLGGLATGYGFVSFRVGSLMLLKKDGRLRFCRYRLAGTAGQCLLAPPAWREEGFPALLYNLSGPAANFLSAALCALAGRALWDVSPTLAAALEVTALLGLYLGLVNGIPLRIGGMPNDGYNALCLRDKASRRAIWAQLAINAAQTEGARLRDLPPDWFELPGGAAPDDPLKGAVWVNRYSRLMDEGRYQDAAALRDELLDGSARLASVHTCALKADRALFWLLEGRAEEARAALKEREVRTFLRQMKQNPGAALVEYLAARAAGEDEKTARARAAFDKALAAWPYPGDSAATLELLAFAEAELGKPVTEKAAPNLS